MKKNILFLFMSLSLLIGCNDNFDADEAGLNLEVIPGTYVAFNPDGAVNTYSLAASNGDDLDVSVEIPNNVNALDNTTVTYTFGGTAVFGVDYTISGATSTGGSVVIMHNQGTDANDNLADNEDIVVTVLSATTRVLEITLTGASSPDGEIRVGRTGPEPLTTATISLN